MVHDGAEPSVEHDVPKLSWLSLLGVGGGGARHSQANNTHMADVTPTTCREFCSRMRMSTTFEIASAEPTEEPPNFITTVPTCPVAAAALRRAR